MGVIRTNISPRIRGGIGEYSYYTNRGDQVVRQRRNNSNYGTTARRSESQQERRAKWGNLVNVYQGLLPWIGSTFTRTLEGKKGLLIVNAPSIFYSLNINSSKMYLTKEQAALGAAVIDSYAISRGILPSIYCSVQVSMLPDQDRLMWVDVYTDDDPSQIPDIRTLSEQIIGYNRGRFRNGDYFWLIKFYNYMDADNVPRAYSETLPLKLDVNNNSSTRNSPFCRAIQGQNEGRIQFTLGTDDTNCVGAAFLHTRKVNGNLQMSSQSIQMCMLDIYNEFSSSSQKAAAINSYGVDPVPSSITL